MAQTLVLSSSESLALRLRLLAEGEGAETRSVSSAADALAEAASARLLVTDATPPGMPLAELVRRWRTGNPAAAVLVIGDPAVVPPGVLAAPPGQWDTIRRLLAEGLRSGAQSRKAENVDGERAAFDGALQRASILVVDDSVTFREYLRGELAREGASVQGAGSGEEALRLVDGGNFDCVMIDLVLPGLDGAGVCERLAAHRRSNGLLFYIVVMSSREAEADLVRSLVAGADDFFGKSQNLSILKAKLRAILRRKFMVDGVVSGDGADPPPPLQQ